MSRRNPYALDPNLMQGFSNLTRALIGSASDDAALARARASDATAALRKSQTTGVDQENEMAASLYAAGNALATNPNFQSQIAKALGIDTLASEFMGPPAPVKCVLALTTRVIWREPPWANMVTQTK